MPNDFKTFAFKELLMRLLEDGVSLELFDEPYLTPEGQTFSKKTIDNLHKKGPFNNPITKTPLPDNIPFNIEVATILKCVSSAEQENISDEALLQRLHTALGELSDEQRREPNLVIKDIRNLMNEYQAFLGITLPEVKPTDATATMSEKYWCPPELTLTETPPILATINSVVMKFNLHQADHDDSLSLIFNNEAEIRQFIQKLQIPPQFSNDFRGAEWRGKPTLTMDFNELKVEMPSMLTTDHQRVIIFPSKEIRERFTQAIHFNEGDYQSIGARDRRRDNLLAFPDNEGMHIGFIAGDETLIRKLNNQISKDLALFQENLRIYLAANANTQTPATTLANELKEKFQLLGERANHHDIRQYIVEMLATSSALTPLKAGVINFFRTDPTKEIRGLFTQALTIMTTLGDPIDNPAPPEASAAPL